MCCTKVNFTRVHVEHVGHYILREIGLIAIFKLYKTEGDDVLLVIRLSRDNVLISIFKLLRNRLDDLLLVIR